MKPQIGQIWKRGKYYFFLISPIPGYSDNESQFWKVRRLESMDEYEVSVIPYRDKFIQ